MSKSEEIPIVNNSKDISIHSEEKSADSVYSTTPNGTRIYYDRAFLLSRRESSLARSPPSDITFIPDITLIPSPYESIINNSNEKPTSIKKGNDDQFAMDL